MGPPAAQVLGASSGQRRCAVLEPQPRLLGPWTRPARASFHSPCTQAAPKPEPWCRGFCPTQATVLPRRGSHPPPCVPPAPASTRSPGQGSGCLIQPWLSMGWAVPMASRSCCPAVSHLPSAPTWTRADRPTELMGQLPYFQLTLLLGVSGVRASPQTRQLVGGRGPQDSCCECGLPRGPSAPHILGQN